MMIGSCRAIFIDIESSSTSTDAWPHYLERFYRYRKGNALPGEAIQLNA
jgi:hypothetical protein